jgi:DNA-binding transcriptional MerR regulator/methylmalonyl-CoA mutase cobalamin-binding subunit
MTSAEDQIDTNLPEASLSMGSLCRLLDLSPELVRAWERRYGAVTPIRSAGGTRRYRSCDVERLSQLKKLVDQGHRISAIASLNEEQLKKLIDNISGTPTIDLRPLVKSLRALDSNELDRQLRQHFALLGPLDFTQQVGLPLLHRIGELWENGSICVASEHLLSSTLRSLMSGSLLTRSTNRHRPTILFATLPQENHEFGLLFAAMMSEAAGAHPLYLGTNLPVDEILSAVHTSKAAALAISMVRPSPSHIEEDIPTLAASLPKDTLFFTGGPGSADLPETRGVERIEDMAQLYHRIQILVHGR